MTIMELGAVGEFIASIAVLITLLALMVQIRLNNQELEETKKATHAEIYQMRADSRRRNLEWLIDNQPVLALLEKMGGGIQGSGILALDPSKLQTLTDHEMAVYQLFSELGTLSLDNHVYQYQQGVLDKDFYESYTVPQIRAAAPMWKALGVDHRQRRKALAEEVERILASES